MREFINEFGKENFTIIMIVVLVILIALVLIFVLEKTKAKKALKRRAKLVLKSTKLLKDNKSKPEIKEEVKEEITPRKENSLTRAKKLLSAKAFDALRSVEKMEDTIKYSEENKIVIKRPVIKEEKEDIVQKKYNNEGYKRVEKPINTYQKPEKKREFHYVSKENKISNNEYQNNNYKEVVPHYENLTYTNEKADEVVYKKTERTPEEAKEKLEEVTKKLVEEQKEVGITVFEEEQEEKSIISYDELLKASYDIDEKNDKLLEDEMRAAITLEELYKKEKPKEEKVEVKKKETVPSRRIGADIISPVYGRQNQVTEEKKTIDKYTNIKDEDSEVFLEKLKNLRSKLD